MACVTPNPRLVTLGSFHLFFLLLLQHLLSSFTQQILPTDLPSCAQGCAQLQNAQSSCTPAGGAEISDQATYDSCFCQSALLTQLYSPQPVTTFCTQCSKSDMTSIQDWYKRFCAEATSTVQSGSSLQSNTGTHSLTSVARSFASGSSGSIVSSTFSITKTASTTSGAMNTATSTAPSNGSGAAPSNSNTGKNGTAPGLSGGAIAGIAVGCFVAGVIIFAAAATRFILVRKWIKSRGREMSNHSTSMTNQVSPSRSPKTIKPADTIYQCPFPSAAPSIRPSYSLLITWHHALAP